MRKILTFLVLFVLGLSGPTSRAKKPKGVVVPTVHTSSRFSKSATSLIRAIESFIKAGDQMITGTEVNNEKSNRREATLRKYLRMKGWEYFGGQLNFRNDSWLAWDPKVWETIYKSRYLVETAKNLGLPPNVANFVVLRHRKTGAVTLWSAMHPLSGSESGIPNNPTRKRLGLSKNQRWLGWIIEARAWKKEWNRLAKKYKVDSVHIMADWNLNWFNPRVRTVFKTMFPGMKSDWAGRKAPSKGTLAWRVIDFGIRRGKVKVEKVNILPLNDSSDHRPVRTRIRIWS